MSHARASPEFLRIAEQGAERPLDEVVELDYEGFLRSYASHLPDTQKRPELFFETSRGCWWGEKAHCTFCGLNGGTMAYRAMNPPLARTYIEALFARYAGQVFRFSSVDNILPKEYVTDLFPHLGTPEGVSLFYEVKADLGQSALKALVKAGVTEVQPGIEALYTPTLKLMRKGTTSMHNVSFLDDCRQLGVTPFWNLLVGFPGETSDAYEHYQRVLPDLSHLPPPMGVYPVRFDRFSPYFVEPEAYQLELEPVDFYRYVYPFSESVLKHLAYYFQDGNYMAEYMQKIAEWIVPLSRLVTSWGARYDGKDGLPRAQLYGQRGADGRWTIFDSRSGAPLEWTADPQASTLIDRMQRPTSIERVELHLRPALEVLRTRHVLFEERGRGLSLVRVPATDEELRPLVWNRDDPALGSNNRLRVMA